MYQKGSALDCNDLLDKLRLFLIAAGWSIDFWGARTSGLSGVGLVVSKGATNGSFLSSFAVGSAYNPGPFIHTTGHDAWTGGDPDQTVNRSALHSTNSLVGPYKQYFFFEGEVQGCNYVHVVVETTTGVFKHFGLGQIVCDYPLVTGAYVYCSNWDYASNTIDSPTSSDHGYPWSSNYNYNSNMNSTSVRADCDGISPRWFRSYTDGSIIDQLKVGFHSPSSNGGLVAGLMNAQPSDETGRAVLIPLVASVSRGEGYFSHVGAPPDLRCVDVSHLEPEQELPIGTDVWMVFPAHRKVFVPGAPYSGGFGYAYKKNA